MAQSRMENDLQPPELALHLAAYKNDITKVRALMSEHYDLENKDYSYGTPLHVAIISGQADAVRTLLDLGADSETSAPDGSSFECGNSLILAAMFGKRAIIKILWDHSVAHDLPSVRRAALLDRDLPIGRKSATLNQTALNQAALRGFDGIVSDLCTWRVWGADEVDYALGSAAVRWEDDTIRELFRGSKVSQEGLNEALLKAADRMVLLDERARDRVEMYPQKQGKVIELLLDAGAKIDTQRCIPGPTALHISARSPDTIEALRALLGRGADVHLTNEKGETALAGAMVKQRLMPLSKDRRVRYNAEAIKMLLQRGASAFATDNLGQTPMHILAYNGPYSLFQFCLEHHTNPILSITTLYGETLLHRAAYGNQVEIVRRLLADGACIHKASSSGWTALLFAISETLSVEEMLQVTNLLLDYGAKATDTTEEGWTALHRIADIKDEYHEGITALVERLIDLGADIEARAVVPNDIWRYNLVGYRLKLSLQQNPPITWEQTPLHWAAGNGSVAMLKVLLRHGANPVARDSAGSTPALCAAYAEPANGRLYPIERRQQVIKLLLTHGAGFDDKDDSGRGMYGWAAVNRLPLRWQEWWGD
ncbi:hypothetical protein MferCBS31731_007662 [Microsporum ferrugineum]